MAAKQFVQKPADWGESVLSATRSRFLGNWVIVRILGIGLGIPDVSLILVFFITSILTSLSILPKLLGGVRL